MSGTTVTMISASKPEPAVDLLFFSSDEKRGQRVSLRLRLLANVRWQDSRRFSPDARMARHDDPPLVLLDYSSAQVEASTRLALQLRERTPGLRLLGVGSTSEDQGAGVLAALRAGVLDFIDLDAEDDEIRVLLQRATQPQAAMPTAPVAASAPRRRGQLIVLLGARAGVGTSTVAVHLATLATPQQDGGDAAAQALLLDLGHPRGDGALYLGVSGNFHYLDALRQASRIDPTFTRTALSRHASGLAVLSQAPGDAEPSPASVDNGMLVERLLGIFDLLLCDLGGLSPHEVPVSLLQAADEIWLIADQGIGTMVSLDAWTRTLAPLQVRDRRVSLVVNRHADDGGADPAQIAERFGLPLLARLPERITLRGSASQGQLLQQFAPRDPYLRALRPLLARLRITPAPPSSQGWRGLLNFARGSR